MFLALAVGIVLGTTALNGPVLDDLRGNIDRLTADKRTLEVDVSGLRSELRASDGFAESVGPGLVRDTLAEQTVLLVTQPDTPSELVDRTAALLEQAGASVTGRLRLLPALSDPEQSALVEDLVADVVPPGVDLPDSEAVERAAVELAAALSVPTQGEPVEPGDAQAVVSAFEEADLVQFETTGDTLRQATLVVVLGGPAPDGDLDEDEQEQREAQLDAALSLAGAFDARAQGALVAGPSTSATDGGLVGALRSESGVASGVSGVDNADAGVGLVAAVLALAEQARGEVGQYGAGPRAEASLPSPTA